MINHFKYPFPAGTDRETKLSHQYQGGQNKWNTKPAFARLPASHSSSHPSQQRGPQAETRSENMSCTPAKDKGEAGRNSIRECLSHGTDFALLPLHYQFQAEFQPATSAA